MRFFSCATLVSVSTAATPVGATLTDLDVSSPAAPAIIEVVHSPANVKKTKDVDRVSGALQLPTIAGLLLLVRTACSFRKIPKNTKLICDWFIARSNAVANKLVEAGLTGAAMVAIHQIIRPANSGLNFLLPVYEDEEPVTTTTPQPVKL